MSRDDDRDDLLARYLLGELAGEEEARLEERFFADADLRQALRAAERDLMDGYVRGELAGERRARFEARFLTPPARRQKVLFADALARTLAGARAVEPDAPPVVPLETRRAWRPAGVDYRWLLAAALVVLALLGVWLLRAARDRAEQPDPPIAEQPPPTPDPIPPAPPQPGPPPAPRPDPAPPRPATQIVTFALTPGVSRAAGARRLEIPRDAVTVQLDLRLGDVDYQSYRATLQTPEGEVLRRWDGLRAGRGRRLRVSILARLLASRDYLLLVSGVATDGTTEEVASYYFEAVKQ